MKLQKIYIDRSPVDRDRLRVNAEVVYENQPATSETFWFEYPECFEPDISLSANPWLSCLAPIAMRLKEPLSINGEVDGIHLENTLRWVKVYRTWFPHLMEIPIEVGKVIGPSGLNRNLNLGFFSSGIDSSFTLNDHNGPAAGRDRDRIDEFAMIFGFDIPLENKPQFLKKFQKARKLFETYKTDLYYISTNYRETKAKFTNWGSLSHGSALAAAALCLEKRYQKIFIASSGGYGDLRPWGSHVMTDPMFSTAEVKFIHDTPEFERFEKIMKVTASKDLMDNLHVCNLSASDENCSQCEKCLRTLALIDVMGELEKCTSFDLLSYDPRRIKRIFMKYEKLHQHWQRIKELAHVKDHQDMIKFIDQAFRFNERKQKQLDFVNRFRNTRLLWRASHYFREKIEENLII